MYNVHYLFLDIDGVLQTPALGDFIEMEHQPALESWLEQRPTVQVVLTSTHREGLSLPQLRERFTPAIAARIVGMTDLSPLGRAYGGRQREIEAWMKAAPVPGAPWVAVDDEPLLFDQPCARLVHTHPWTGLLPEHLEQAWSVLQGELRQPVAAVDTPKPAVQATPATQSQPGRLVSPADKLKYAMEAEQEHASRGASKVKVRPVGSRQPPQGFFGRLMAILGLD